MCASAKWRIHVVVEIEAISFLCHFSRCGPGPIPKIDFREKHCPLAIDPLLHRVEMLSFSLVRFAAFHVSSAMLKLEFLLA